MDRTTYIYVTKTNALISSKARFFNFLDDDFKISGVNVKVGSTVFIYTDAFCQL